MLIVHLVLCVNLIIVDLPLCFNVALLWLLHGPAALPSGSDLTDVHLVAWWCNLLFFLFFLPLRELLECRYISSVHETAVIIMELFDVGIITWWICSAIWLTSGGRTVFRCVRPVLY